MNADQRPQRAAWVERLLHRTDGPVWVQLSAEVDVDFPVEVFTHHGPGFVRTGTLGLGRELEDDLIRWQRWWQGHVSPGGDEEVAGDDAEWQRWGQDGHRLVERLRGELGEGFHVRYP